MPAESTATILNCRTALTTHARGPHMPLGYQPGTVELAPVNVGVWELGEAAWAMYDEAVDGAAIIRERAVQAGWEVR